MKVAINEKRELKSLKVLLSQAENLVMPLLMDGNSTVLKEIYRSICSANSKLDNLAHQPQE